MLSPTTLVEYINTTLAQLVVGQSVFDTEGIWQRVQRRVVRSHSLSGGAVIAFSGIDMALWDLKGKVLDVPVYALLGGERKPVPTYSGSITMGFLEPSALVAEVTRIVETGGFRAVKLRVGDSPRIDLERVGAVREAFGADFTIMVDANTGYDPVDLYALLPGLGDLKVAWLEEPYPPDDVTGLAELRGGAAARCRSRVGENLFGRAPVRAAAGRAGGGRAAARPSKCGGHHRAGRRSPTSPRCTTCGWPRTPRTAR